MQGRKRCNKRRFRDELACKIALAGMLAHDRDEKRYYYHRPCRAWHLTSETVEEYNERKNNAD